MQDFPWLPTIISAVPTFFIGIWTFIQWYAARKDKDKERESNDEKRREDEHFKERHELAEINSVLFAQLRTDVDKYRKIIEDKNIERFYAWDRARFWHQKAWDMRNEAAYARQIVESARRLAGEPNKPWEVSLDMPPFDGGNGSSNASATPPKQTA